MQTGRDGPPFSVIADVYRNRMRNDVLKNNLPSGVDDEFALPYKGFRWGLLPRPEFPGQRGLIYRGKQCFQYPID
jgi:hypothetical protein